ncbi:MAG TPA: class I SAM-dependent methyltransferase [Vicinamibacteria bacterium]|nr:class I SAM-dependent methyltransferase [Vicinamibacteria bacterium]
MNFDSLAASYDRGFGLSPTGRLFRFRVAERVMSEAPPGARVLDIGCGTGEDAIWLAAQGYAVHGIDESPRMIETALARARESGSSATFACRSAQSLSGEPARFDVVISNFGALNCVPLATWAALVPALLAPAGRAFVVLMGRRPLPEGVRRGFGATDRGPTAAVRIGPSSVNVHYESAGAVRRALAPSATVSRVEALGCLVPGPGYEGFARRHPILLGVLAMSETLVRRAPFFQGRGDHTLFEFQRR